MPKMKFSEIKWSGRSNSTTPIDIPKKARPVSPTTVIDGSAESYDGAVSHFNQVSHFKSVLHTNSASQYLAAYVARDTPSTHSQNSHESLYGEVHQANLLQFVEGVRASLQKKIAYTDVDALHIRLTALLKGETKNLDPVKISVIVYTRLDKLIEDIMDTAYFFKDCGRSDIVNIAAKLHKAWQDRFGEAYNAQTIETQRLRALLSNGALHDVILDPAPEGPTWRIAKWEKWANEPAGKWWPNMACAVRDGAVSTAKEIATLLPNSALVLPMLTGIEEEIGDEGNTLFIKKGTLQEVHIRLMTYKGRIKVLRGHQLNSKFAPSAGIRYDGEYTVVQYGHHLDQMTENFEGRIQLKRVKGREGMDDWDIIASVPRPSQLDDWRLYRKMMDKAVLGSQSSTSRSETE